MRTVGGDAAAAWRMPNTGSMVVLTILTAVASVTASAPSGLYGLTMIHNSPVMTSFFSMDLLSGNVTLIGDPITQETGTGDLRAIDKKRSIYYFLGDTHAGATLVGIDMTSGSVACSSTVPLKEIGFVGMGQTLEMDTKRDRLVLAGIVTNSSGGYAHQILTAPLSSGIAAPADHGAAPADCAPFTKAGTFGIADYVPMLHSSAYDEDTQTLYVTVAPNKTAFALAVIDLGSKTLTGVDLEGSPPVDELQGMSWDPDSARVIGLMQNFESSATNANSLSRDTNGNGVNLMSLDPLTAKWTVCALFSRSTIAVLRSLVITTYRQSRMIFTQKLSMLHFVKCADPPANQHGKAQLGCRWQRRGRA